MRIGVMTFHAAMNYGSVLQAYALQEYLTSRGHDVSIIDFRSAAQERLYPGPVSFSSVFNAKQTFRRLVSGWPEISFMYRKKRAFDLFRSRCLRLTGRRFRTLGELERYDWSGYDMLVSGSDQIWNTSAIDFSMAYFLVFADGMRKVAYSPSMGPRPSLPESLSAGISAAVSGYEALSVREMEAAVALAESGAVMSAGDVSVLPDPVLLFDSRFYGALSSLAAVTENDVSIPGKYVLYYSPGRRNLQAEMLADAVSRGMMGEGASSVLPADMALEVLQVSDGSGSGLHSGSAGRPVACGPAGFLRLVRDAECTVGTSFHLMVFSMIFGKDFWCPDAGSDSRKVQLLTSAGFSPDGKLFRFGAPETRGAVESALAGYRAQADSFFSSLER